MPFGRVATRWLTKTRDITQICGVAAFDGENVWVANGGGTGTGNVTKLRARDGTVLGTFNVGLAPIGVAFDGANIWVANGGDDTVSKLRASDGTLLGTFNVGSILPSGIASMERTYGSRALTLSN